jgi:hypothetical protein
LVLAPLLRGVLLVFRRYRETPLHFQIDSQGVVAELLQTANNYPWMRQDHSLLIAGLNALVSQLLAEESTTESTPAFATVEGDGDAAFAQRVRCLSLWVGGFYERIRAVDVRIIDVMLLRLESHSNREIARRLEFGLRLVERLLIEMQADWGEGVRVCSSP